MFCSNNYFLLYHGVKNTPRLTTRDPSYNPFSFLFHSFLTGFWEPSTYLHQVLDVLLQQILLLNHSKNTHNNI